MALPVLWQFIHSHYSEKARWALDHKRVAHERRSFLPGFHVSPVRGLTGQTALPVLVLDGRPIHDSTRIIEALERIAPDPPLYPAEPAARSRALALEEFFDEELGPHIRRLGLYGLLPFPDYLFRMFAGRSRRATRVAYRVLFPLVTARLKTAIGVDEEAVDLSRRKMLAALDRLEREIGPTGYLVGDRFSVADLTACALLSLIVAPPAFTYPPPSPAPEPIARAREALAVRPEFRWVQDIYRRHRGTSTEVRR